jgi:hypothetical protein
MTRNEMKWQAVLAAVAAGCIIENACDEANALLAEWDRRQVGPWKVQWDSGDGWIDQKHIAGDLWCSPGEPTVFQSKDEAMLAVKTDGCERNKTFYRIVPASTPEGADTPPAPTLTDEQYERMVDALWSSYIVRLRDSSLVAKLEVISVLRSALEGGGK